MSWYVETLILNCEEIRSNIYKSSGEQIEADLDDDDYNNLLILESKIKELKNKGFIADKEIDIIKAVSTGRTLTSLEKSLGISREAISKIFYETCEKLSYLLGGQFTDEGYLNYMRTKYKLSEEEIENMEKYMRGIFKHRIRRLIND